jgi:hypothetical protein
VLEKIFSQASSGVLSIPRPPRSRLETTHFTEVHIMNVNIFTIIAASAISATAALPAHASVEVTDKKVSATQSYTAKYLQQSVNFYAALDHKHR